MSDIFEVYNEEFAIEPFGLNNTGVICHFNSLLQSILSCTSVISTVLKNKEYLEKTNLGKEFYIFVSELTDKSATYSTDKSAIKPSINLLKALIRELRVRKPSFRYGPNQESASEGLILFLDMLDIPSDLNPISKLFYHRQQADIICEDCKYESSTNDVSVQFNLFYYDSLKEKIRTPEEFGNLLRYHKTPLPDYKCEKCKKNNCYRQYKLRLIPEVIVIIFNLYTIKRTRQVPDKITFTRKNGPINYKQVAQIEHFGSLSGGHYIAKALRKDGIYMFNDSSVSPSEFKPNPNTYMMFYHMVV